MLFSSTLYKYMERIETNNKWLFLDHIKTVINYKCDSKYISNISLCFWSASLRTNCRSCLCFTAMLEWDILTLWCWQHTKVYLNRIICWEDYRAFSSVETFIEDFLWGSYKCFFGSFSQRGINASDFFHRLPYAYEKKVVCNAW